MNAELDELMAHFSRPRPSGSRAERAALMAACSWLEQRGVGYELQPFRLRPLFFECVGAWLIGTRTLLAAAAALGWGWRALPIALIGQLGGAADIFGIPLVTWPGVRDGASLVVRLGPPDAPRELLLAAHVDSKTELLDHRRRAPLLRGLRPGIALTFAAAALAAAEGALRARRHPSASAARALAVAAALPVLLLSWALGLNMLLGRAARQSSGAVDNGAACAILLALAGRLASGAVPLRGTRVTIALFGGEEVNMQGSRAYLRGRARAGDRLPSAAVNLELMGQRGGYVRWQRDGNALRTLPCDAGVAALVDDAVRAVTGAPPRPEGLINSDAYSFLDAGVPAATLGSFDPAHGTGGLHRPTDSRERVDVARLAEAVAVLEVLIRRYDGG